MRIGSKTEFFRLWEAGALGNKLRTWRDPIEAITSGVPRVGFRQIGIAGGGKFSIVENREILTEAARWDLAKLPFMICEAAPDERGTLQGEVCRTTDGWHGTMGLSRGLRMRDAIAQGLLVPRRGLEVVALLNHYMDPSSRADLDALLELYPEATVEFTCYECLVGSLPGRNTIFWEVRDY